VINYLIIAAILLVLMALKLTKFVAVFIVIALVVILVAKNTVRFFPGMKKKDGEGS
jgi:hypothetical protein